MKKTTAAPVFISRVKFNMEKANVTGLTTTDPTTITIGTNTGHTSTITISHFNFPNESVKMVQPHKPGNH